jgi:hypothetical protein
MIVIIRIIYQLAPIAKRERRTIPEKILNLWESAAPAQKRDRLRDVSVFSLPRV